MDYQEAIEALRIEGKLKISGQPKRFAEFLEGLDVAISAMQELQEYKKIELECIEKTGCGLSMLLNKYLEFLEDITELFKYREIGTLDEVREAVDKQKAKKPDEFGWVTGLTGRKIYKRGKCKNCGCLNISCNTDYCRACGQHIDWSEEE